MARKHSVFTIHHGNNLIICISSISEHAKYPSTRSLSSFSLGIDPLATPQMLNLLAVIRIKCSSEVSIKILCHFKSSDCLSRDRIHSGTHTRFACELGKCTKSYGLRKDLGRHQRRAHADPALWLFSCVDCGYKTDRKDHFTRHRRSHEHGRIKVSKT